MVPGRIDILPMRRLLIALALAATFLTLPAAPRPAAAQSSDALTTIDLINQLRARYGLPAYTTNATLIAVAQAHSEYQASIDQITHYGADGSHPRDRIAAAGYGIPGRIFVSENIYGGTVATPQDAVTWWTNSPIHFQGMTSTRYVEIGVGVATSATGLNYYTALFAYPGSGPAPADVPQPVGPGGAPTAVPRFAVQPVVVATPGPNGALWHIVQPGQTLYAITIAYGVTLPDLLALNNLTANSIIYPNEEILIHPAPTPTPTLPPTVTPTPTRTPVPLIKSTASPTPAAVAALGGKPTLTSTYDAPAPARPAVSSTRRAASILLILVGVIGALLIVYGLVTLRAA